MSELDFPTAYPRKSITNLYPRIWIMLLFWSECVDALESHRFPYIYGLPILLLLYRPCVLIAGLRCVDKTGGCSDYSADDCANSGWVLRHCRKSCNAKCDKAPLKPQGLLLDSCCDNYIPCKMQVTLTVGKQNLSSFLL